MRKLTEEDLRLNLYIIKWLGENWTAEDFLQSNRVVNSSHNFKCAKLKNLYFDSNSSSFMCSLAEAEKQQTDGKRNSTEHIQKEGQ